MFTYPKLYNSDTAIPEKGQWCIYTNRIKAHCRLSVTAGPVRSHFHRVNGPAIIHLSNNKYNWYLNGKLLTFEEFIQQTPIADSEKLALILRYK